MQLVTIPAGTFMLGCSAGSWRLALRTNGDLAGRRDDRLDHRGVYRRRNFSWDYSPD